MNRRVFEYDAVSTSIENVDSGCALTVSNGLSSIREYDSVLCGRSASCWAPADEPSTPWNVRPRTGMFLM
jgi:hypothetical protein